MVSLLKPKYKSEPAGKGINTLVYSIPLNIAETPADDMAPVEAGYYKFPTYYETYKSFRISPAIYVNVKPNGMAHIILQGGGKLIEDYISNFQLFPLDVGLRRTLSTFNHIEVALQWIPKDTKHLLLTRPESCRIEVTQRLYQGEYVHWKFPKFLTPVMTILDYIRLTVMRIAEYDDQGNPENNFEIGCIPTTKMRLNAEQMQLFKKYGGEATLKMLAYSTLYFYSTNYGPSMAVGDLICTNPVTLSIMGDFKSNDYNGGNILVPQDWESFRQALHVSKLSVLCPPTNYFDREARYVQESF